ncbi:hypothetical protein K458DRAFT_416130 [Lentithecium fluviatile CBS 122367]|uniref:Uncharacterized protein n=1 Tax=Lentithecium fluviatile CBS 122367 TaxID=1168545 RepID=A0A6G1J8C9_9PLEO|nr:hypothetical protein K458DRAFT_416130 [Lentithecium fluviatile CBS 122367]
MIIPSPSPPARSPPSDTTLSPSELRAALKHYKAETAELQEEVKHLRKRRNQLSTERNAYEKQINDQMITLSNMDGVLDELRDSMVTMEKAHKEAWDQKLKDFTELKRAHVHEKGKLLRKNVVLMNELRLLKGDGVTATAFSVVVAKIDGDETK